MEIILDFLGGLVKGRQREITHTEVEVLWPLRHRFQWCDHELRTAGSHQEASNKFSSRISRGNMALLLPWIQPSEGDFTLLPSRTVGLPTLTFCPSPSSLMPYEAALYGLCLWVPLTPCFQLVSANGSLIRSQKKVSLVFLFSWLPPWIIILVMFRNQRIQLFQHGPLHRTVLDSSDCIVTLIS